MELRRDIVSLATLNKLIHFIGHFFRSNTRHGIHSPFVYALIEDCLYKDVRIPLEVLSHFEELKSSDDIVSGLDHGKGVKHDYAVSNLARKSASQTFEAKALAGICQYHQCGRVLELGTNLGKSIAAMASVNPETKFVGVDGNGGLVNHAKSTLSALKLINIELHHSRFDEFFRQNTEQFEMVFIDGDHHFEATLKNYASAKSLLKGEGPIVLHDIYWSEGMRKAWKKIKADNDATVTIDLFFFGLVYFRREQRKEHFSIRYPRNILKSLFF
ncbi:class I SAM-dependent methyltransferase [Salibacteraceae bacterium]|nr:class I SAM-dependent methyltransferase [Salibacteraceae bacterium]